jgi:DNA-binding response OmpR family regulator
MKILVVEDEELIALVVLDALAEAGYDVLGPARTADEALTIARAEIPELVLADINLADDTKGTDLARMLRAELDIPVVFLSGNIQEAQPAQDVALGHIAKPCSPTVVLKSVDVVGALLRGALPEDHQIPPGLTLFRNTTLS